MRADVSDTDAVDAAFNEVEAAFGPVELLVNNAGITRDGLVARMSDEQWDRVLARTSPARSTPSGGRRPR